MREAIGRTPRLALFGALLVACGGTEPITPEATVFFLLDAPLCSMALPVRFSIDGTLVGIDTFRVHLTNPHIVTRGFPTTAGRHVLGAHAFGNLWSDTTVALGPGVAVTDTLSFYCS